MSMYRKVKYVCTLVKVVVPTNARKPIWQALCNGTNYWLRNNSEVQRTFDYLLIRPNVATNLQDFFTYSSLCSNNLLQSVYFLFCTPTCKKQVLKQSFMYMKTLKLASSIF